MNEQMFNDLVNSPGVNQVTMVVNETNSTVIVSMKDGYNGNYPRVFTKVKLSDALTEAYNAFHIYGD